MRAGRGGTAMPLPTCDVAGHGPTASVFELLHNFRAVRPSYLLHRLAEQNAAKGRSGRPPPGGRPVRQRADGAATPSCPSASGLEAREQRLGVTDRLGA